MNPPPAPALDYATQPASLGAWRLLRLAVILWASLVLVRHATYWEGAIADQLARSPGFGPVAFPFAAIEAAAEAVILVCMLVVALGHPAPTRRTAGAMRLLGFAYVLLVLSQFALRNGPTLSLPPYREPLGRALVHLAWQLVSELQLLVVPAIAALGIGRTAALPRD